MDKSRQEGFLRKTSRSWAPLEDTFSSSFEDQLIAASNSALVEVILPLRPYREAIVLIGSYDRMSSKIFISYLNTLKREYWRFVLFYDGAPWHTSSTVKNSLKITGSNHASKISKVFSGAESGGGLPERFGRIKKMVSQCFIRKKFNLDIINYLCPQL